MNEQINPIRQISEAELAALAVNHLAYIKLVPTPEGPALYEVFNADGTALAKFEDREIAFAAVRQNDMEPVSVH
ncbi:MAG: DUF1150 family protein [Alphaproteobacteria bacterium]